MRRVSYLSAILFVISAWFTIFFFWNFIESNEHVRGVLGTGNMTFRGNEFEVVNYYMAHSAPYAFYALMTGIMGWVIIRLRHRRLTEIINITNRIESETDAD